MESLTTMPVAEFLGLIGRYGPGGIFLILWWFERNERRDAQKELHAIAQDAVRASIELKTLINQLSEIFRSEKK